MKTGDKVRVRSLREILEGRFGKMTDTQFKRKMEVEPGLTIRKFTRWNDRSNTIYEVTARGLVNKDETVWRPHQDEVIIIEEADRSVAVMAKDTTLAVIDTFKDAGEIALKIELGKTFLIRINKMIGGAVPWPIRGLVTNKLVDLAIAGAADIAVRYHLATHPKAKYVSECMVMAAMTQLGSSFKLPNVINRVIDSAVKKAVG